MERETPKNRLNHLDNLRILTGRWGGTWFFRGIGYPKVKDVLPKVKRTIKIIKRKGQ